MAELGKTSGIVPVVVFLKPYKKSNRLTLGSEYHSFLSFDYIQCVIPHLNAVDYLESPNIVARLNLPNMKRRKEQKLAIYASAIRGLNALEASQDLKIKYLEFIDIYSDLTDNERILFEQEYSDEDKTMSGFNAVHTAQVRQEALLMGMQQGMQQGLGQGERQLLQRLLSRRFEHEFTGFYQNKVANASTQEIEHWALNILEAKTLAEVFA